MLAIQCRGCFFKMEKHKITAWALAGIMVLMPLVLLTLPADYFDNGPAICPSKRFFDIECAGCGMTRAVMHLIHFDLESAVYYNSLSLIVTPVLAAWWIWQIWRTVPILRKSHSGGEL